MDFRIKFIVFAFFFSAFFLSAQEQVILNIDDTQLEVRTTRAVLALEINKGENFQGTVKLHFGTSSSSLQEIDVATISQSEDYNLKTYTKEIDTLTAETNYSYKWELIANTGWVKTTELQNFRTLNGFGVLPGQVFEIPEEGLKVGDTIGVVKYENTTAKWKKVHTFFKTTFALKPNGEAWAWGLNRQRQIGDPTISDNVVYDPVRIRTGPDSRALDFDGDHFMDRDEYLSETDPRDPNDYPSVDTDGDYLSDLFEAEVGLDPNVPWLGGLDWWTEPQEESDIINRWEPNEPGAPATAYNNEEDPNGIFGLYFHDVVNSHYNAFGVNKFTRELFHWSFNESGNAWDKNDTDNRGYYIMNVPQPLGSYSNKGTNILWDKIFAGYNEKLESTGIYGNPKNFKGWDASVAGIDIDGNLYVWGVVEGISIDYPMQIGAGYKWLDVTLGDGLLALREDGALFELGVDIPLSVEEQKEDQDGDGVPDIEDAFPWDPNASIDSDTDGAADNWEESWMQTDPNNPDSDGDGYLDGEDQLPNDPNYYADSDWDGLPDELDPDNDNWDTDGDGARDGDDADPLDPAKRWDCDKDGVSDEEEWARGSDACVLDTDGDGVDDKDDLYPRSYYYKYDSDGDGLPDALEEKNNTDPNNEDSDGDGYKDGISRDAFNSLRIEASQLDCDIDCNSWDYFWRFWDLQYDCDGDGQVTFEEWTKTSEACLSGSNARDLFPNDPNGFSDNDWDDIPDGIDEDDDNDGVSDEDEIRLGSNPLRWDDKPKDSDGDNVPDIIEEEQGLDPNNIDTDGDGSWDGWDAWPLDPTIAWDEDKDRLENWVEEEFYGTDPENDDTDGDGVKDGEDAFPLDANSTVDSDGDGLSDEYETANGLKPNNKDSDGDGKYDAPCDIDKMVWIEEEYWSFWDKNWRECEGYWKRVDTDGDGVFNDEDDDDDNDGISDQNDSDWYSSWEYEQSTWVEDKFPKDPNEWADNDNDGIGDNEDTDDDNDGVLDAEDDYPNDSRYTKNTDKPTIENGGLTDWDNDGIYGEDYNEGDGWIDEVNYRYADFIPDELDEDDDGDLFLDVDEIANGTDPKDRTDFPGSEFTDADGDGLSNGYEIEQGSDPYDWDTDDDGISDGWKFRPNWNSNDENHKLYIEYFNADAVSKAGDTFRLHLNGHNSNDCCDLDEFYTPPAGTSASSILNYFAQKVNDLGSISYNYDSESVTISATVVDGKTLVIESDDKDRQYHFEATRILIDDGVLVPLWDDWDDRHSSHEWKSDFYRTRDENDQGGQNYRYVNGSVAWSNDSFPYLMDMFPTDPDEYWDTDEDGIGDNSDDDIDGDGLSNGNDPFPFVSGQAESDTDNDGIIDSVDPDDDNDNYLDVDENHHGSDPLDKDSIPSNNTDSDNDGLSDDYENNVSKTDPDDWDSDGDMISDGFRSPWFTGSYQDFNWVEVFEIPRSDVNVDTSVEYMIRIQGRNSSWDDKIEIKYNQPGTTITGGELLTYFANQINSYGEIYYNQRSGTETFEASVDGRRLVIRGDDNSNEAYFQAFTLIYTDNLLIKLSDEYHNWDLGEYYYRPRNTDSNYNGQIRYYNKGRFDYDNNYPFLIDAFPNDPDEYWDTDGDGVGDFSDNDIDGDGTINAEDEAPFDSEHTKDTDGDGIPDGLDSNKDNDSFLDIDDPDPLVFTPEDGGLDSDRDGISDPYELQLGSDPNNWDSDGDGVSDGWKHPGTCGWFNMTNETTWKDDFYRERSWDCGEDWFYFKEGRTVGSQDGGRLLMDMFPNDPDEFWDTDGDGIGDNADEDIDGDGLSNDIELKTVENNGYWIHEIQRHVRSSPYLKDTDADGYDDNVDQAPNDDKDNLDTDGDGIGDSSDSDIDGDGESNRREEEDGTDPKLADSDGDGVYDGGEIPGAIKFDEQDNWLKTISFVGSSTLANESFTLIFNEYNSYVQWEDLDRVNVSVSSPTTINDLAILVSDAIQEYDFSHFEDTFTTSVSGSTVILTGEDDPDTDWRDSPDFGIDSWDWRGSVKVIIGPDNHNNRDLFPLDETEWQDSDHDEIGDNADTDDDNDGLPDVDEIAKGTNPYYWDTDGDGHGDEWDQLPLDPNYHEDMDGDGIADEIDDDLDGDGLTNDYERTIGSYPWEIDSDGDGYIDGEDAFPSSPDLYKDTDQDRHGDAWDPDDDGDGFPDKNEIFEGTDPLDSNSKPSTDSDEDFLSDDYERKIGTNRLNADTDGDGVIDGLDQFPNNKNAVGDYNNNGTPDYQDGNDDEDHWPDWVEELLPELDPKRPDSSHILGSYNWEDFDYDMDGVPNDVETGNGFNLGSRGTSSPYSRDTDGDGCDDAWDDLPSDPGSCDDGDGDGIGDEFDDDWDNDGFTNQQESSWWVRTDPKVADSDGDGTRDSDDYLPLEPRVTAKTDITAALFDFDRVGNNTYIAISSWNLDTPAGAHAAVDTNGTLYYWGVNHGGLPGGTEEDIEKWEKGQDHSVSVFEPTPYQSSYKFKNVKLGKKFGIAVTEDDKVISWGTNLSSQLGKGNISTYERPGLVNFPLKSIAQLTAGDQQSGAINKDGKLRMFGSNDSGQLGIASTNPSTPQELNWDGINNIEKVKVTETETQILTQDGAIWSYGDNESGQLGRGYKSVRADDYTHKKIETEGWDKMFASSEHVYAFKFDGSMWVWGKNNNYDLGLGVKNVAELDPTQVEGVNWSNIKSFTTVRDGFAYITNDGELYGAGNNFFSGSWVPLTRPRKIGTDSDWSFFHDAENSRINILVEKENGSIWAAGTNNFGQLTDNPCPDNYTQIDYIDITQPHNYQKERLRITHGDGEVSYKLYINSSLVSVTVSNSIDFADEVNSAISADNVLNNLVDLNITQSNNINSSPTDLVFTSKQNKVLDITLSLTKTGSSTVVTKEISTLEDPYFGTVTYTLLLNGIRTEFGTVTNTNLIDNFVNALENNFNINQGEFDFSKTVSNSLRIENTAYNAFSVTIEPLVSINASATTSIRRIQDREYADCSPNWLNELYQLFDENNDWDKISMGLFHTLLLKDDGTIWSVGRNNFRQLGRTGNTREILQIGSANNWTKVDASENVSFAINSAGEMYSWGKNDYGTLGVGDYTQRSTPTKVAGDIQWQENLGGFDFQIARAQDGKAYGWGYRKFGKLGALGKIKSDEIQWTVDESETQGIIDFDEDTELLIVDQNFINYLETTLNFEEYFGDNPPTAKGRQSTQGKRPKRNYTHYQTDVDNAPKGKKSTSRGVGKWKVKKKVNAFGSNTSISSNDATSSVTPINFAVVDVNEAPSDINLSNTSYTFARSEKTTIATIEVVDPDIDDEITVSMAPNSQYLDLFEADAQGLHLIKGDKTTSGQYTIIIKATDFEGLILEQQFVITIENDTITSVEEIQEEAVTPPSSSGGGGSNYNPMYFDTDGDGVVDQIEFNAGTDHRDFTDFPLDTDNDGIYDFNDGDLDNDGYANENDAFPTNPNEWSDIDNDGIGDNSDEDTDNDGVLNVDVNWREESFTYDAFPNDPTESIDTDNDGIGNNGDDDDDNDGYLDANDAFPLDASEWADTDNDSIGDNTDDDIDGDNYLNIHEEQAGSDPYDPNSVPADLDGDFFPDTIDLDIDGDGILNEFDTAPNFANPNQEYLPNDPNYISIEVAEFFSPNGDGINDTWTFPEIQRFPLNQVWIYASDGTLVFHEQSYANTWDGTFNGGVLPVGSYLYRVDVDGNGTIDFEGWLYLSD